MTRTLLRDISILVFVTVVMALAVAAYSAEADTRGGVRLRDRAEVSVTQVLLSDVAELTDGVMQLSGVVVATLPEGSSQVTVTLADVRRAMEDRGVHWGRVSLSGYRACAVTCEGVTATPIQQPTPDVTAQEQTLANPTGDITPQTSGSLEELVIAQIAALSGVTRDELVVTISDADRKKLAVSALSARFEIEPLSGTGLGLVPVTIRRFKSSSGTSVDETIRVQAHATRRTLAVVLKQGVSKGQTFTPSDIEVREVLIDSPHGTPLTDVDAVVGQTAAALLRAEAVLYPEHLRSPVMIKRGQLVTVRASAGGLMVRTICRATEDGALGDVVQVRNERSKQDLAVRVTGPQEAAVEMQLQGAATGGES